MKLRLVVVKARFYFRSESNAKKLYQSLKRDCADVCINYLRSSEEWEVFAFTKGNV